MAEFRLEKMCKGSKEEVRRVVNGFLCSGFNSRNLGPAALAAAAAAAAALLYSRPDSSSAATTASHTPWAHRQLSWPIAALQEAPKIPEGTISCPKTLFPSAWSRQSWAGWPKKLLWPAGQLSCVGSMGAGVGGSSHCQWPAPPPPKNPLLPPLQIQKRKNLPLYRYQLHPLVYRNPPTNDSFLLSLLFLHCISHHSLSAQYWPTS